MARQKLGSPWLTTIRHLKMRHANVLQLDADSPKDAVRRVVHMFGNNQAAEILGVSASQPSRWLRGEPLGQDNARRLADFDYALQRALRVFHPEQAAAFFTFPQPFLGGARPIDVLITRGVGPVISALDQIEEGAFA